MQGPTQGSPQGPIASGSGCRASEEQEPWGEQWVGGEVGVEYNAGGDGGGNTGDVGDAGYELNVGLIIGEASNLEVL